MNMLYGTALISAIAAFGVTSLLMPALVRYSHRRDWTDDPDGSRKLHSEPTPRTGGIAIWFGLLAGVVVALMASIGLDTSVDAISIPFSLGTAMAVICGGAVASLIGFFDDMRPMSPWAKISAQAVAAAPLLATPDLVAAVGQALGGSPVAMTAAYPLLIVWVIFMMNATNLIDGLDGLAGGLTVIAVTFLVILGGLTGGPLLLALATIGAVLAFLRFNMPPARVFMGDTGSLLIGYLLAVLGLTAIHAEPTSTQTLGVLIILGIPGLDTVMAFMRRVALGRSPFRPDSDHIHHRMLERASDIPARAVSTFYLIGITLGLFGLLIQQHAATMETFLTLLVSALALIMLWDLRYFDITSYTDPKAEDKYHQREISRRTTATPVGRPRESSREAIQRRTTTVS